MTIARNRRHGLVSARAVARACWLVAVACGVACGGMALGWLNRPLRAETVASPPTDSHLIAQTTAPTGAAAATPGDAGDLRLDTWDKTYPPNMAPDGWEAQKFSPLFSKGDDYFWQFVHAGDEHYLHVRSGSNNSYSVGYKNPVNLKDRPWIEWDWKMIKLPKGGDVRVRAKDDQAGSMCLIVDPGLTSFDSSLCYLFENDGPKDEPITSTQHDNLRYLILRTAKAGDPIGMWLHERRNLLADYKRLFGHELAKDAYLGVAIDSNDTASSAEAMYRNFVLRKS
jgi:hypothetical protein